MKAKAIKLAYEAPETSVDFIEMEHDILISGKTNEMKDMDWNSLGDDDDFSIDY